jgi:tRNA threonylcarbamoyladenosine biosynthesis protein TsaB
MSLILQIDTATSKASVSLAFNGRVLSSRINEEQKQHASFVQPAIIEIMKENGKDMKDLSAVAITIGPGSYTGLRVSLASAKGICFALQIPLIAISTLKAMAATALYEAADLYCPMIDARRMEVFTAVFNADLSLYMKEQAMILNENSFTDILSGKRMVFIGNGVTKWKQLSTQHQNARFINEFDITNSFAQLSFHAFKQNSFADLAYTEPVYLKEFNS